MLPTHHIQSRAACVVAVLATLVLSGCGRVAETVDPNDRLCRGRGAFGASITGTPAPVEMCLADDADGGAAEVHVTYADGDNRYLVVASHDVDGVTYEISLSFVIQQKIPHDLRITTVRTEALADVNSVWFYYREAAGTGGYEYVSSLVQGEFRVTLSSENVAAGTFGNVAIELVDTATGADAGTRAIPEAFFAVTPDP